MVLAFYIGPPRFIQMSSSIQCRNIYAAGFASVCFATSTLTSQTTSARTNPIKQSKWNGFIIPAETFNQNRSKLSYYSSAPSRISDYRTLSTTEESSEVIQDVRATRLPSPSQKVTIVKKTDDELTKELKKLIKGRKVVLFMKGSPDNPMCGFSRRAVQILIDSGCSDFSFIDVLKSERIRELVKKQSGWPTIPQLYVGGEFIGGCDVMVELFQTGELRELLAKHGVVFEEMENSNKEKTEGNETQSTDQP